MLTKEQILHLLHRCERHAGIKLAQTRRNLCSDSWLPTIWEIIVVEAASRLGSIAYESNEHGPSNPDTVVDFYDGKKMAIEATLRTTPSNNTEGLTDFKKHPVYRTLKDKVKQAKKSKLNIPFILCAGTDRIKEFGDFFCLQGIKREEAAKSFFQTSSSISAIIIAPITTNGHPLCITARTSKPILILNKNARTPLVRADIHRIWMLDLNRWRYAAITTTTKPFTPREINDLEYPIQLPPLQKQLAPVAANKRSQSYVYHWKFNHLKIFQTDKNGAQFALTNNDEFVAYGTSPQQVAESASVMFQPFPTHIFTARGIEKNPEPGVPKDLSLWALESF